MRISDLVKITGIPRETIHFYTRENLLPKPRKTSRNQADYSEEHVERLRLIKELQDRFFLPLSAIKKILKEQKKRPEPESMLHLKTDYFSPMDQFLPGEIRGEAAFLEATGMSADRLVDFEEWRIIEPVLVDGEKVYSHDDIKIGKVTGDMRRLGVSTEKGFSRDALREWRDLLAGLLTRSNQDYWSTAFSLMSEEKAVELARPAIEMWSILIYHMYRRMALKEVERRELELKRKKGLE